MPATPPPCSTDIIGRGLLAGSVDEKDVLHFSYVLNGGACTDALYALVIRNKLRLQAVGAVRPARRRQEQRDRLQPAAAVDPHKAGYGRHRAHRERDLRQWRDGPPVPHR
jgi:hypothetical protein